MELDIPHSFPNCLLSQMQIVSELGIHMDVSQNYGALQSGGVFKNEQRLEDFGIWGSLSA